MPLLSRKSNKKDQASYSGVEKLISASSHADKPASQRFKKDLLSELRTEQFSKQKNMAEEKRGLDPESKKNGFWASNNVRFAFPLSVPMVVGVLVVAIIATTFLIFDVDEQQVSQLAQANNNTPLVIDQYLSAEDVEGAFELVALNYDSTGINPDTSFQLTAKIETTVDKIKESFSFSPAIAYAIESSGENSFRITPADPLMAGSIVASTMKIAYKDESGATLQKQFSWTYQVQEEFQVISSLPRHQAVGVPLNSGIEIELSHVGFEKAEENFSITPQVAGKFELHRKTLVFVPEDKLAAGTVYTVKLNKDIELIIDDVTETLQEDFEFQFETANGSTIGGDGKGVRRIEQITNETSSQEPPVFLVSGRDLDKVEETDIQFYKFADLETYKQALYSYTSIPRWTSYSRDAWSYDNSQLEYYSSATVPIQDIGNYWQYAVAAPDALPIGFYLVQVKGAKDYMAQALLQVSDISAYVTTSNADTVVWVHDALTGQPVSGAVVTVAEGEDMGTTDDSGVLQVDTPEALSGAKVGEKNAVVISALGSILYLPLSGNAQDYYYYEESDNSDSYWSYLYIDQPFYQPDATVNYWGLVDPRDASSLNAVTITLTQGYWREKGQVALYEKNMNLGKFGTFEGSLELGNLTPGGYYLSIKVGDDILMGKYFDVMTYTKPAYQLDITPANIGLIQGDSYTHVVKAEFFDGTAVNGLDLDIYGESYQTDDAGIVNFDHAYSGFSGYGEERTRVDTIEARPLSAEEAEITAWSRVKVFAANRLIDMSSVSEGAKAMVSGTVHQVDLDKFNNGEFDFYDEPYGAVVANQKVSLEVTREWYNKKKTGTRYDFINKVTKPIFEYNPKTEIVVEVEIIADANGAFNYEFDMVEGSTYSIIAKAQDEQGRTSAEYNYTAASGTIDPWSSSQDSFYLRFVGDNAEEGYIDYSNRDYSLGDQVEVLFYRSDEQLPDSDQMSYMFIQAQDGIRKVDTQKSSTYSFSFEEEHIPNIILQGVWFDGRSYWASDHQFDWIGSGGMVASFSEKDRDMDIEVSTDKVSYQPGDEVVLDIQVTRADGKTNESVVNVNLIDEALYAIMPERGMFSLANDYTLGFNEVLYRDVGSGILASYASHRSPIDALGVEGGGGWDSRTDFSDKALFETVTTDSNGKAQVKFTLPDNITSWRITTHAIDEDRYAGSDVSKLIVTQPFFVTATLNDTYLLDDQPVVKVRAYGNALSQDDQVVISWKSESLGISENSTTINGSTAVEIPISNLQLGQQMIEFKAKSGEYSDAIGREFEVLPSRLAVSSAETYDVEVGWSPEVETDRNYNVIISDKHVGQFYSDLFMKFYTHGDRLDQQITRMQAVKLLNQYFDADINQEELNASEYQVQDGGGLSLFPYSDQDLILSAHVAASDMADEFDSASLSQYFEEILNDETQTTLRHAVALYGLAGLHEPVLLELREVLNSTEITDVDRLFLTLALAELGSIDEAKILYAGFENQYSKEHDQYKYLELGDNTDYMLENTMTMAIIGALIQDEDADAYFNYVRANWTKEIVLLLQEMNFITARMNVLPQSSVEVTYKLDKQQYTANLEKGQTLTVPLTSQTSDSFGIVALQGEAKAMVEYLREATEEELNLDSRISIERNYERTTYSDGELVKITIHPEFAADAMDGMYQVTDYVPSGMKVVTQPYLYDRYQRDGKFRSPYRADGQRVSFRVWKNDKDPTFTYYARITNKGTFTAERPVIQSMESPSVRAAGNEEVITIE